MASSGIIRKYMDGNDTGWNEYVGTADNDAVYTGTIAYRKIGNIVSVRCHGIRLKTALSSNSGVILCKLPSGYRPTLASGFNAVTNASVTTLKLFPILITADGNVYIYTNPDASIPTNMNLNFNIVFLAD